MNALPLGITLPTDRRLIRPPDPSVRGATLAYMRAGSAEVCRRLVHLAFRDARTALDLTYAAGRFWKEPLPPGLSVTSNNWDPEASTDLHVDFTATGLASGSYDLVVYDPPHVADGGRTGIMARRYGTAGSTAELRALIAQGAREAWRISSVGLIVKVADHHHGGRFLAETDWVKQAIPMPLYTQLATTRAHYLRFGRHTVERVPRSNGAVYLVFRHGGPTHVDFDALYRRQALRSERPIVRPERPEVCSECDTRLDQSARKWRRTCCDACRQRAYRRRRADATT